jgi:hypothetical protein
VIDLWQGSKKQIDALLSKLPVMFQSNQTTHSCLGAAVQAALVTLVCRCIYRCR